MQIKYNRCARRLLKRINDKYDIDAQCYVEEQMYAESVG